MIAAVLAALLGAVLFLAYAKVREYGERHWSTLSQNIIGFTLLGVGVIGIESVSGKPVFALVGIAVVVVAYRIVAAKDLSSAIDE
jgi:hypothetical protein